MLLCSPLLQYDGAVYARSADDEEVMRGSSARNATKHPTSLITAVILSSRDGSQQKQNFTRTVSLQWMNLFGLTFLHRDYQRVLTLRKSCLQLLCRP